jgi:hypothetical protein
MFDLDRFIADCRAAAAERIYHVHSVTNPIPRLTGAIFVYGGDFFSVARSEWDPETLVERAFHNANARLAAN